MSRKREIEGVMFNVVNGYASQVGCGLEEKEKLWSEIDEVMQSIPRDEREVISADFNRCVEVGDEEAMGGFSIQDRNSVG